MNATSRYFNTKQIRGLNKLGTVFLPGTADLPSFAKSGCARNLDRILEYMPEGDRGDLKMLLGIFAILPSPMIAMILKVLELSPQMPTFIPGGALLRFIRIGLRGLLMSLYYGDSAILAKLDYHVEVYTDDLSGIRK